jgi:hypothetical protein
MGRVPRLSDIRGFGEPAKPAAQEGEEHKPRRRTSPPEATPRAAE